MEDPFGEFEIGAIHTHEMFVNFMDAGFTREEALYLVGQMLSGAQANG